jgi:hypothetical protein
MLTAVKTNQRFLHQVNDFNYLTLGKWTESAVQVIEHYDAILITASSQGYFEELVRNIKTHPSPSFYLKPIFYKHQTSSSFKKHTDGQFQEQLSNETAEKINQKIKELRIVKAISSEQQIGIQLLQHLYTRTGQLTPKKSRYSKINYQFEFIDLFYSENEFNAVSNLQSLVKEGLLEAKIKDRVQLCYDCHDGFVVFKETCPKCHSIDIKSSDVIHHFVCAHVAPEAQYKNDENDDLSCPKCDKHLRHIGIDYDKPSSVYNCGQCDHDFQQAAVIAECHSCDKKNQFEELIEVNINDYKITMKGMTIAKNGSFKVPEAAPVSQEVVFNEILKYETKRAKINDSVGFVISAKIKSPFFAMLDAKYKAKFWIEIKQIIANYTPFESHILLRESEIVFLLLDKDEKAAEAECQRLLGNLNILMEDNLGGNVKVSVDKQQLE